MFYNRAELKENSKHQLKGNWSMGVVISLVYFLLILILNIVTLVIPGSTILTLFITPQLYIGFTLVFVNFVKNNSFNFSDLFKGFNFYLKCLGLQLWMGLWVFLWALLLFIPGIIKSYSYSMMPYIISDNPNVTVRDAMKISMKMTNGYKIKIFIMSLSFIGWALLCMLTLGIGFLWLNVYIQTTMTNLYFELKDESIKNGVCEEGLFTGEISLVY